MAGIKDENYLDIQGWMVTRLGLKGNELLVYAIIYSFSQDGEQKYQGSAGWIASWLSSSRQTVYNVLRSLEEKGLIEKTERIENGVKFCDYRAKNLTGEVKNFDKGGVKIFDRGSQKTLHHNNIDNNISDNKEDKERKKEDQGGSVPVESKSKKESYDELINEYTSNPDLRTALYEFIKMRKLIKKPMTNFALKNLIAKLDRLATSDADKITMLYNAIEHCWQSVYPLKPDAQQPTGYANGVQMPVPKVRKTEEEILADDDGIL